MVKVEIDKLTYYLGACSQDSNYHASKSYEDEYYWCNGKKWEKATKETILGDCDRCRIGETQMVINSLTFPIFIGAILIIMEICQTTKSLLLGRTFEY